MGSRAAYAAGQPGVIPLRPLAAGEILAGALAVVRRHPRVVLGLSAAVAAVTTLLQRAADAALGSPSSGTRLSTDGSSPSAQQVLSALRDLVLAGGVTAVTALAAQVLLTGMVTAVLGRSVLGRAAPLPDVWHEVRPRLPTVLGITLTVLVGLTLVWAVAIGVVAAAGYTGGSAAAVFLGLLLVGPAVVVSVWLAVMSGLAGPAAVLERQGVEAALRRSFRLVRGSFWRVFGILVLVQVAAALAGLLVLGLFSGLAALLSALPGGAAPGSQVVDGVATVVTGTLTYPVVAGAVGLLYVDLRMRREGLDQELAQAARVG
jgi:hypothetical protein